MTGRNWVWVRGKVPCVVPKNEKQKTIEICEEFINATLVPRVVREFNPHIKQQQCVGISLKSHKSFFRFTAHIKDTRDDVIEREYDEPFARLEYRGGNQFLCAYMRYNGEWVDLTFGQPVPLAECLTMIAEEPHFAVLYMFGS